MRLATALRRLEQRGLLLLADPTWPSLVTLVTKEPVRGSWWGHTKGNVIYNLASALEDDPAVLTVKLAGGKVTFVHAAHWPDLLALVAPPAAWQTRALKPAAKALLQAVERQGSVRLDQLAGAPGLKGALAADGKVAKAAAKELEARLLILTQSMHTEKGAHATVLRSWDGWAAANGVRPSADAAGAKERLEALTADWPDAGKRRVFPWPE